MEQPGVTVSRRAFLLGLGSAALSQRLLESSPQLPWMGPAIVRKVFLARTTPTWPRPDLDVMAEKTACNAVLTGVEEKHKGAVTFTGGDLVRTPEQAEAFARSLANEDAVLVVDLTSGTGPLLAPLGKLDQPVLLYSRPYSGWSYVDVVRWVREGKKADLIVTSEPGDLDAYVPVFRALHQLRHSKVLVISPASSSALAEAFHSQFGTAFAFPGYGPLREAFQAEDVNRAIQEAAEFTRGALRVAEPARQDIVDAIRFYHGVLRLLESERANAITVDCLGGFQRGDLPAYPCVSWSKLNDRGMYGVCEADIASTLTQILFTSISGKPGFVTDPVFDTSRNEIIHAHCVSATRLHGIGGAASPYILRTHMETAKGVSMQVLVPTGDTVTVTKFLNAKTLAISTGQVTSNVDDARGCRTKFRTRVANARKLLEGFTGGLHRVVYFGDYTGAAERTGRLLGIQVVTEG